MTSSPWRFTLLLALGACSSSVGDECGALSSIAELAYSSDGRWLAAAHPDGTVTVLEVSGTLVRRLSVTPGSVPRIALTEDGGLLVAGARDVVRVWRVSDATVVRELALGPGAIVTLKLSDAPEPFVLGTRQGAPGAEDNLRIWRVADGALVGQLGGSPLATFTHADAAVLLLDPGRRRFDVVSFLGRPIRAAALPEPLAHPAFANDGAFFAGVLAAGSADERLATMSVGDDAFVWRSSEPSRSTRGLVFLENPSRIVQLGDRSLVYDLQDGRVLRDLSALDGTTVVAAAPDGSALAAAPPSGGIFAVSSTDGSRRALGCPADP